MIFKTFDSDSDKFISKIGILNRSFEQWGEAIRARKLSVQEKSKDLSLFDNFDATATLQSLRDVESQLPNNKDAWTEYFSTLDDGSKWQVKFVQDNDLSKVSLEQVENAQKAARESAIAYNNSLEQMTFGAKAANVAMKGLAIAGNMIIYALISKGIEIAVTAIDNYIHRVERAQEAIEEITSDIAKMNDKLKSASKTVKDSAKRFAELAQGVNQLTGKNISLNTEDYEEFLDLNNQLAELFPSLPRIFDENGNAIVQLSGDVDTIVGSLKNLVDVQRQITNQEIADKLPDLYANTKTVADDYESQLKELNGDYEYYQGLVSKLNEFNYDTLKNIGTSTDESLLTAYNQVLARLGIATGAKGGFDDYGNHVVKNLKRTIIHWSDELKQTYKDELDSWDYDPEVGTIDTVYGMSDRFGEGFKGHEEGWEIAFTPILPDGTFLSKDTVEEYISAILEQAYADDGKVTDDELKEIDAQGLQIGNTFVKGIYAGIDDSLNYDNNGNWAEVVGRLMHFSGKFGAPQIAKREISDLEKKYGEDGSQKIKDFLDAKGISGNSSLLDEFNEVTQNIVVADIAIQRWNEHVKEVDEPTSFSDAWKALKSTTKDEIKGLSNDLLELANKGQLTAETFKKADSTDYFKNLGISADEAVNKINALAQSSSQLSSMSSQVSAMSNALKTKSENGYVSADTLAGFNDDVKGMDSWKEFERLMGDSTSSVQECKEAAGQLATEWINSNNFLTDLNESTKEYYITQLDAMGVENAREIVANRLLQKQKMLNAENEFAKKTGKELADATDEEIVNFIREADCTDAVKEGISEFILEKKLAGETKIDLIPDLEALANYVEILGYAADAIRAFDNARKNVTEGSGSFAGAPAEAYKYLEDNAQGELDDVFAKIKAKINGTIEISANGSKSSSSSSSSSSNSDFDWIQVKLTVYIFLI